MSRDIIEVWSKLCIVADWDFDQACIAFSSSDGSAAVSARGYSCANPFTEQVERSIWFPARFYSREQLVENCDAGVSRREFNDARNGSASQLLTCAENVVQCFLGRVFESFAHAHD
jgi:hypothetical protein